MVDFREEFITSQKGKVYFKKFEETYINPDAEFKSFH
jgi:hypothetical protein